MKIIRVKNYEDMSEKAAELIKAQITAKPASVLGLATGSTVLGLYEKLAEMCRNGILDFSCVKTFNLDEYVGLPGNDRHSYRYYMEKKLFSLINIKPENTFLPDGTADDPAAESAGYNAKIEQSGGIDLQLLGLGSNGHIGFNEPCGYFANNTHVVELDESTIQANARNFNNESDVPRRAVTMGIGNIMRAGKIVLCVSGAGKATILNQVLTGPVTPEVPGSILQFHTSCTVVADEDALADYDRDTISRV